MASLGYNVFRYQLAAYVIAGAIGGLSGFLLANATEFVSPAYMSWQRSGELIIMILLGGIGTLQARSSAPPHSCSRRNGSRL